MLPLVCSWHVHAEILSFDGNQATATTTHTITATDWADYLGGGSTFVATNSGGRLFWRGSAGDGQFMHFDLSSLSGLTVVAPAAITLQNGNPTWGGGVNGSFVATPDSSWTTSGNVPAATAIINAVNATGSYGWGSSVSWGIGSTTFQGFVNNQGTFHGLGVIGGSGSQLHFNSPMNPYLTVQTGSLAAATGLIVADTGGSTWNAGSYTYVASDAYSPVLNTLTINSVVAAGLSGAGSVTINNGGTVFVNGSDGDNRYWAVDSTRINAGGVLKSSGHSHLRNLTLAGGELAGTSPSGTWGGWTFDDATIVTGGVTSTISAQQVNLDNGTFVVDAGSTLNFTGSARAGSLNKGGAGTMTISAYQNYAGGTTVDGGTLNLNGAGGGYSLIRGAITVNPGATLALTGGDGTGLGYQDQVTSLAINGGTFTSPGTAHVWNITGGITLTGGTLQSNNGISSRDGSQLEWNRTSVTTNASASTATIGGRIRMRADGGYSGVSFTVADGAAATDLLISAAITEASGGLGIAKAGAGTMVLTATNTYSGPTVINAGTVEISSSSADNGGFTSLGTGPVTINSGATLVSAGNWSTGNEWNGGAVGAITVNNGGTWTINSVGNTVRNGLAINGGTINGPGVHGDWGGMYLKSTSVAAGGNAISTIAVDTVASGGQTTFTVDGGSQLNYTGAIRNVFGQSAGITKAGPGTMVLTGNNSYSGVTAFEGGVVNAATFANNGSASSLGVGTGDTDANAIGLLFRGGTLRYTGSTAQSTNRAIRLSTIGGGGTLDASGSLPEATLSFTASSSPNFFESPGNRTLTFTGSNTGANTFAMAIGEAGGTTSVVKTGGGTWVLEGNNSYSGSTTINAGTLVANGVAALGNGGEIVFAGGTLRYTASSANQPWASRMKNSTTAAIAIDTDEQFVTLAGVIDNSNTAGLTKSGPGWLSLAGTNTYTGPTTVSAGTLAVNGSLGSTAVSVAANAMLSGSGSIAGPVSVAAGGILAPGNSPGTLTIANTLSLTTTSIIDFEINAGDTTVGGGINDLITGVTGLTLDGTLNLSGGGDFTAVTAGTAWRLFDYSGTLTDNSLTIGTAPTLNAGLSFVVDTSTANQVNLAVVPEPSSVLLAGLGLAAAGWLRLRRQRR